MLVAVIVVAVAVRGQDAAPSPPSQSPAASTVHDVTYVVEGGNFADVTISTPDGTAQFDRVRLPWRHSLGIPRGGFAYVSAQSVDGVERTITCKVQADGRVIFENTSEGEFVIASCSGTLD